eukprot:CAMPEP_0168343702 /NCGR_PEP_ID=MMETSP0213-20121227/16297_1 /TAXON_ID=151035 /ORGANISM="Euplotes harpa, Strain FSP1.4" /LENGTH=130 /DNA_ID=CAMNT_0008351141 /DNA_START=901 /DNA_END=1293 /DNA_ORIENTATION=-
MQLLSRVKRVFIENIPETHPNSDLQNFLMTSAFKETKVFVFGYSVTGWKSGDVSSTPIEMYVEGLEKALKGVTKEVYLNYWVYSKDSLQTIVKASANAERIIIRISKLDLENELDFSGPAYRTAYFSVNL